MPLTFGSLFAGIGGFDLGFERAGMVCKWQVEIDEYANRVLAKHWPNVRRWPDVRTWPQPDTERVDVICGGFPCQDISYAGNGAGIHGERSGLFFEAMRIVREMGPRIVVLENVAALLTRGMGDVLGTLASLGFDAEWEVIPACAFGAPHSRERVFVIAYSRQKRWDWSGCDSFGLNAVQGGQWNGKASPNCPEWRNVERWLVKTFQDGDWESPETTVFGVADGVPDWLDRNGLPGNAVVPQVAEWIGRRIVAAMEATS